MKSLLVLSLIISTSLCFSQVKKKTVAVKPEIDKLYDIYKKSEEITLHTPFGELQGLVTCNLNVDNKPESIEIKIETDNREAAARFIADLIEQKLKNKYKDGKSLYNSTWEFESIKESLDIPEQFEEMRQPFYLTKGNMYTKIEYKCGNCEYNNAGSRTYFLTIVTGDKLRIGGKKASEFKF